MDHHTQSPLSQKGFLRAFVPLFLAVLLAVPAMASSLPSQAPDYEAAVKAYDSGRFSAAYSDFRRLAEFGHGGAEFMLGVMYFYGRGVERDYAIAAIWFFKSARQGNPAAQLAFGSMFIRGVGVSPDNEEAYKWLSLAAESQIPEIASQAETLLQSTAQRMTADEIADAETAAGHFHPVRTGPLGLD